MLFLQLKSGEYLTIGEDIAIQVFQETSDRIRVAVTAPRDLSILRGEVRERNGANRPSTIIPPGFSRLTSRWKYKQEYLRPGKSGQWTGTTILPSSVCGG